MAASGGHGITKGATHSDASYVPLSSGIQADRDLGEVGLARRSVLYTGPHVEQPKKRSARGNQHA